jgi:hypothetical protein
VASAAVKVSIGCFVVLCVEVGLAYAACEAARMIALFLCFDDRAVLEHFLAFRAVSEHDSPVARLAMRGATMQEEGVREVELFCAFFAGEAGLVEVVIVLVLGKLDTFAGYGSFLMLEGED